MNLRTFVSHTAAGSFALLCGSQALLFGATPPVAQPYKLAEIMALAGGTKVTDVASWTQRRRPELLEFFTANIYGRAPARPDGLTFKVVEQDPLALNGKATRREVDISLPGSRGTFTFRLVVFLPNAAKQPAPAFLLLNHRGDVHTQVNEPFFPVERIVERGYAAAGITLGQLSPDDATRYREGVLGFLDGPDNRSPDSWRTIAAWAWGGRRAMDYLETDKDIDAKRVAVVGHSRGGKTALWCGAQDERFALVIGNNSGLLGAEPAKREFGGRMTEVIRRFAKYPYWLAPKFDTYTRTHEAADAVLPVDQHMLLALVAPRALYIACAAEDTTSIAAGEFLSATLASPAWKLFGKTGLTATEMPELERPIMAGHIGYHVRRGGHGMTLYDWDRFMDFGDIVMKK